MRDSYDCLVVGAGPAGCTTAALVAERGFATLLVDCEMLPRRPELLDQLHLRSFVPRVCVQFVSHTGQRLGEAFPPFSFPNYRPLDCRETAPWEPAKFNRRLFENALAKGAECCDGTRVNEVATEGDRACGVQMVTADGLTRDVWARVIVDASGGQAFMAPRLGRNVEEPPHGKAAIVGHYRNARRDFGEGIGDTIVLNTRDPQTWFWFTPLSQHVTSIGLVGDASHLFHENRKTEQAFEDELVQCPTLADRLISAELVHEFRIARNITCGTRRRVGDGWIVVGHGLSCTDPVHSLGAFLAMKSAETAAEAIVEGLDRNDLSVQQLGKCSPSYERGVQGLRQLVYAFYSNPFGFGEYLRECPDRGKQLVDLLIDPDAAMMEGV